VLEVESPRLRTCYVINGEYLVHGQARRRASLTGLADRHWLKCVLICGRHMSKAKVVLTTGGLRTSPLGFPS
jgi:hypothetical protein